MCHDSLEEGEDKLIGEYPEAGRPASHTAQIGGGVCTPGISSASIA